MTKPMYRSRSYKKARKVTRTGKNVVHYRRGKNAPHVCAICIAELNGIGTSGGKSRRTNSRQFGGVLCSRCSAEVIKFGSRVEQGEIKLDDVGTRYRAYVLQLVAH